MKLDDIWYLSPSSYLDKMYAKNAISKKTLNSLPRNLEFMFKFAEKNGFCWPLIETTFISKVSQRKAESSSKYFYGALSAANYFSLPATDLTRVVIEFVFYHENIFDSVSYQRKNELCKVHPLLAIGGRDSNQRVLVATTITNGFDIDNLAWRMNHEYLCL